MTQRRGSDRVIGVDLGASQATMAWLQPNGDTRILPNADGELSTPAVVHFANARKVTVGRRALEAMADDPEHVAFAAKRGMGDQHYRRMLGDRRYTPPLIVGVLLRKLMADAELAMNAPVGGVVLTLPSWFNELQRQATQVAARMADVPVVDVINEPTAVMLAHAWRTWRGREEHAQIREAGNPTQQALRNVAVIDIGAGGFDATLFAVEGRSIRAIAADGDQTLGGMEWDYQVADRIAAALKAGGAADLRELPARWDQLLTAVEPARRMLTDAEKADCQLTFGKQSRKVALSRKNVDAWTDALIYRLERRLNQLVRGGKMLWGQVDQVIVVGGATRMPRVQEKIEAVVHHTLDTSIRDEHPVARGAAIYGGMCMTDGRPRVMLDAGFVPASEAGLRVMTYAPAVETLLRGALVRNVSGHSLGVMVNTKEGKRNAVVLPRQSTLPAGRDQRFTTYVNDQEFLRVIVLEGEAESADDCTPIALCDVGPLPKGLPAGSPVSVRLGYDHSGRLQVDILETTNLQAADMTFRPDLVTEPSAIAMARQVLENIEIK